MTPKQENKKKKDASLETKQQEAQIIALQKEIEKLERDTEEMNEVAKKAQHDYINLKMDFDQFRNRTENNQEESKVQTLLDVTKKFLPFVEDLRKSIGTIPKDMLEEPLSKGVSLTYEKFLQTLESMGIKSIEAIGLDPDSELHEPVSMQPTQDQKLKGKIIQEFERGFVYEKNGIRKVITTSKVIIGQ